MRNQLYHICHLMLVAGLAFCLVGCQDREWDDHYGMGENISSQNVMEILESHPQYSQFCQVLKENHLDTLLSADQTFTIWAPTNDAMISCQQEGNAIDQFLKNHICRYVYNGADLTDTTLVRVKMLNGKFQNYERTANGYTFADIPVASNEMAASNGLVHELQAVAPFYQNLYEYIQKDGNETDSLATYLKSFDTYEFDKVNSTSIGKNQLGQLVYDSVFTYSSKWMKRYGDLYLEDSLYTMQVPTNSGWKKGLAKTSSYFRTFGNLVTSSVNAINVPTRTYELAGFLADSLSLAYTKENMAANLVFSGLVNPNNAPGDSLVATSGVSFHHPANLFAGAVKETMSNGELWRTDEWNYQPSDCFFKKIEVEAENAVNRYNAYSTVLSRSSASTIYRDSVSEQKYIEVTPTTTNARTQPTVQFTIPNVLAATYDIYCVFVPAEAYSDDIDADSTKVRFFLNYVHEDGTMKEDAAIVGGTTHEKAMTKMYVGRKTFPFANFSKSVFFGKEKQDADCVRLRVQANVSAKETVNFSRTMRIDKIIFEPVIE